MLYDLQKLLDTSEGVGPCLLPLSDTTVMLCTMALGSHAPFRHNWQDNDAPISDERWDLADALEEAGCDNANVQAHCRKPGPHVRGCWVVDALLGNE